MQSEPVSDRRAVSERRIALIGAPFDLGSGGKGSVDGPAALREAGIAKILRARGRRVIDRGDAPGIVNIPGATIDGCHHLREVAASCRALRDAVAEALAAGDLPLVLGGDHSLAMGSLAAVARHCAAAARPLFVVWLDAHADFNTPASSPTGHLYGMPVAVATGEGHPELTALGHAVPMLDLRRIAQIGVRSVDPLEDERIGLRGLRAYRMAELKQRGMASVIAEALEPVRRAGGHLHVSLDIDFLDPSVAPGVGLAEPDGPGFDDAAHCLAAVEATGLLGSFDLLELSPSHDPSGATAARVIDLVARAFAAERPAAQVA
jgi:arginase